MAAFFPLSPTVRLGTRGGGDGRTAPSGWTTRPELASTTALPSPLPAASSGVVGSTSGTSSETILSAPDPARSTSGAQRGRVVLSG